MRTTVLLGFALAALAQPLAAAAKPASPGAMVFTSNRANGDRELYVVSTDGSGFHRLTFNNLFERQAAWSPDRSTIAFSARDASGNFDIYTVPATGGPELRLTTDPARDDSPQWTPDGRIVFQKDNLAWIVNADGSGAAQLPTGPGDALTPTVSSKGTLAFSGNRGGSTYAIYTMQLDGRGLRQVTFPTAGAGADVQPRYSPNGTDIAFMRDNGTQDNDLYVVHANGSGLLQLTYTPNRLEFYSTWSGNDIVFAGFTPDGGHLYSVPSTGGIEKPVSTSPQAPFAYGFDGPLDSSLWHTISDPGGSVGPVDGRLVASISGSAVPGGQFNQVDEHIGSQCTLNGDFDYQVDYSLLVWPDFGGFYTQLAAFFANGGVARSSSQFSPPYNQQYWANTNDSAGSFTTTDTSGTFRLVRVNGIMSAYVMSPTNPDWRLITSGSAPGSNVYGMGLWAGADQWAHVDGSVAYDNFRLNSGALTCPSWWVDLAPDIAP